MIPFLATTFDSAVACAIGKGRFISLDELAQNATLKGVDFKFTTGFAANYKVKSFIVNFDHPKVPQVSGLFCLKSNFVNKRCDFIVFVDRPNHIAVAICDMKSSLGGCLADSTKLQFENSELFMQYVAAAAQKNIAHGKEVKFYRIGIWPSPNAAGGNIGGALPDFISGGVVNTEMVNIDQNGRAVIPFVNFISRLN